MHLHGSLGVSNEMPLIGMWAMAPIMGIADGPTEVHKVTIARQVLKGYKPQEGLWPERAPPRPRRRRTRALRVTSSTSKRCCEISTGGPALVKRVPGGSTAHGADSPQRSANTSSSSGRRRTGP